MGLTQKIAAIVTATRYRDLDVEVVHRTCQAIADGISVAVAGHDQEPVKILVQHVRAMGARPAATIWGHGMKTSPVYAAYVNGVATHVLDFEPMWSPPTHSVSPTVPVAFALAETTGASGREIVTAVAKGMEFQGRMQFAGNQYVPEKLSFHPPGFAGVLSAAVTAGHLLGLDEMQLRHALGIAASRAGTLLANVGSMTKSTHCGNAGAQGLDAALLAARGFTANPDVLEAHKGMLSTFYPDGFDESRLLAYGKRWRVVDPGLAIKLFPSQFGTHFSITAALGLRPKLSSLAAVRRITLTGPVMKYVDRPFPETGLDGKFSFQYTAACALLDGHVGIDSFSDARRFRADMEMLLPKITLQQDPAIPGDLHGMRVEIEAEMDDGARQRHVCTGPKGSWGQPPLTREDHRVKLEDCLRRMLAPRDAAALIRSIESLPGAKAGAGTRIVAAISGKPKQRANGAAAKKRNARRPARPARKTAKRRG